MGGALGALLVSAINGHPLIGIVLALAIFGFVWGATTLSEKFWP